MNGGKSRSEIILSGEKTRPQSNTWNPFCYSTEAFTAETMQSIWEMMLKLLPAGDARRAVIERSIRLAQEK
ncbi:hypothetical protein MJM87_18115, partial [Salmonella enterica subsp. enterica serovar Kentucky]|nr:hypothetical protein [Salmonella enterica subsp. enterica serovar Kentucky]